MPDTNRPKSIMKIEARMHWLGRGLYLLLAIACLLLLAVGVALLLTPMPDFHA